MLIQAAAVPSPYPILATLPNPLVKPVHKKAKLLILILIGSIRLKRWLEGNTMRAPEVSGLRELATAVAISP